MGRQLQGGTCSASLPFLYACRGHLNLISEPKLTPPPLLAKSDNLSWFADHLQTLKTHTRSSKVNVSLYVTKAASSTPTRANSSDARDSRHSSTAIIQESDGRDKALESGLTSPTSSTAAEPAAALSAEEKLSEAHRHHHHSDPEAALGRPRQDLERGGRRGSTSTSSSHGHEVRAGRPDAATLIRDAVSSTPADGRVLVAACGPDGLMRVVRNTTASLIRGDGPGVELHCEQFGW